MGVLKGGEVGGLNGRWRVGKMGEGKKRMGLMIEARAAFLLHGSELAVCSLFLSCLSNLYRFCSDCAGEYDRRKEKKNRKHNPD